MKKVDRLTVGVACSVCSALVMGIYVNRRKNKMVNQAEKLADKHFSILNSLNQWLILKQKGIRFSKYFKGYGYENVAIYGMGTLGQRLYDELVGEGIRIDYVIDQNAENISSEVEVFSPNDDLPDVRMIIVTAIYNFDEIETLLEKKINRKKSVCNIVSLETLLLEIENYYDSTD